MRIVMVTPEAEPYSKTGGLADMTSSLSKELIRRGHEVKLFSPLYRCVKEGRHSISDTGHKVDVSIGRDKLSAEVWKDGSFYFIGNDSLFCRKGFYGEGGKEYEDNALRFSFFAKAVMESLTAMGERVDIVHCHDWQSALIPLYLNNDYSDNPAFAKTASIFTIHNLAYQGLFSKETMDIIGLPMELFNQKELEFYGKLSFIKGGLVFSDILTTVSKRYSHEIRHHTMGCGLEGLLREREADLFGIVNGVDYEDWDPATDMHIETNYNSRELKGKRRCKEKLKSRFGLGGSNDIPIVGMVSRLDPQKGFDIIEEAEKQLMELPIQMVFLGTGSESIQEFLLSLAKKYPKKVAVSIGYDENLAHMIEAGSDIYLMPSRYEPCGLNHLYSLKYGTLPVVRATGGLDDTIINYNYKSGNGNGFKFRPFTSKALIAALKRAVNLYRSDRKEWNRLQKAAMVEDHSWRKSVVSYEKIYRKAIKRASERRANSENRDR